MADRIQTESLEKPIVRFGLKKQVETKEDGRILIYYSFERIGSAKEVEGDRKDDSNKGDFGKK